MIGATPTKEQVAAFEKAHKLHFIALVQAAVFRISLARKFGLKSKQFLEYNRLFFTLLKKFAYRQKRLELGAGIPEIVPMKELIDTFSTSTGVNKLIQVAKQYDQAGKGIGIIPLIIWAVIALVGMFTASQIVDETNTTTSEVKELVDSTGDFCKANNLTPDQCKAILMENVKTTDTGGNGLFSGLLPKVAIGVGIYFLITNWESISKKFTSKKAA